MNFNRKDVVTGFVIIAVVIAGAFLFKRLKTTKTDVLPIPTTISFKQELEDNFKFNIPDSVDSIELKDVSGNDGRGIATPTEILADLEDPAPSYFYQGWLENTNGNLISLGKMRIAKGGWLLEYGGAVYPEYKKVIVSLEKVFDNKIETKILEGSF